MSKVANVLHEPQLGYHAGITAKKYICQPFCLQPMDFASLLLPLTTLSADATSPWAASNSSLLSPEHHAGETKASFDVTVSLLFQKKELQPWDPTT